MVNLIVHMAQSFFATVLWEECWLVSGLGQRRKEMESYLNAFAESYLNAFALSLEGVSQMDSILPERL